ncbi:MAG: N-acetyltransferase [Pseudomonadota bacterium]
MYSLSQETEADRLEVEALYDLSFAPGREALSSYRLREGVASVSGLNCVARDTDGVLAGAIRYWPIRIGEQLAAALLLGPIAVHPTRQGEGLGVILMTETLSSASALGWERVVLIGDAPYYGRFGFEKAPDLLFPPPTNPDRVLRKELKENAFSGVYGTIYPETVYSSASKA